MTECQHFLKDLNVEISFSSCSLFSVNIMIPLKCGSLNESIIIKWQITLHEKINECGVSQRFTITGFVFVNLNFIPQWIPHFLYAKDEIHKEFINKSGFCGTALI